LKNEEEAQKHKKNAKKEVGEHFFHDRPADFGAGSPQGPPSRARGILDKSSNGRIKNEESICG
tara:strand:- start:92 stop:280 length:189 start_codon:yes stop_codon:yes gene_type:complete